MLLHLVAASKLGTPLHSLWTLFPALPGFSSVPGITNKTVEDAEAEGLIFTYAYSYDRCAVVMPELFVEEIAAKLGPKQVRFEEVLMKGFGGSS